jgi:hypothetical protein
LNVWEYTIARQYIEYELYKSEVIQIMSYSSDRRIEQAARAIPTRLAIFEASSNILNQLDYSSNHRAMNMH